jgi:hypothetical protein
MASRHRRSPTGRRRMSYVNKSQITSEAEDDANDFPNTYARGGAAKRKAGLSACW